MEDPDTSFALQEALLDLGHPALASSCGVHPQISEDVIVLRITFSQQGLQSSCSFFGAGEESSLVRVQLQTSFFHLVLESAEGTQSFSGRKNRVAAVDVKADVVHPSLKSSSRMVGDHGLEWLEQDELGDGRRLRASLKDPFVKVLWLTIDAFSLNCLGASVDIQSKLEVQGRICQFSGWFDDGVKIHMVVEASEGC